MIVLGLDLSLTSSGFSSPNELGVIKTPTKGAERLSVISHMIVDIVFSNNCDIVALEGYSFASRNSQAHSIGELGGAVRMRLWEKNIPFIEIPPTCRAKFATGRGNAAKTEVMSAVSARTGLVFSGSGADDMCDAWILRQMCETKLKISSFSWPSTHLSALDKIDWAPLELCSWKQSEEKSG
jgi:Holliday junction resolvasome RuvABC endonuclease subunit